MADNFKDNVKETIDRTTGAGTSDQIEGHAQQNEGRAKQEIGEATGDNSLRAEGVKDQAVGKSKDLLGEIKEGAENLLDKAKDALRNH